jgi:tripartite-type tricarboxylate transporter receptor subunit TctC
MPTPRMRIRAAAILALLALAGGAAHAQSPAATPIKFIVPFPPGGAADQTARLVAQEASTILGTPIVLENKAGAGGMIAAELAARAKPDGKTFFVGANAPLVLNQAVYAKMPYDPEKSFVPVAGLGKSPLLLVTRKDLPVQNVKDLVALAKKDDAGLTMASAGNGNITHLTGEYATSLMGFKVRHVPFSGSAPAITNLMGGNVDLMFDALPSSMQQAKAGAIRPLAILDDQRFPQLPNVPTFREMGFPDSDISAWIVLMAPAQTPRNLVLEMNKAVNEALKKPELVAKLQAIGEQPMPGSPEDLGKFIAAERTRWLPLARSLGIRPE